MCVTVFFNQANKSLSFRCGVSLINSQPGVGGVTRVEERSWKKKKTNIQGEKKKVEPGHKGK